MKIFEYFATKANSGERAMSDDIMTVRQVADFLKVTERTIYRLAADHQIPSFKVGGSWRFRRNDLAAWMSEQATRALSAEHTTDQKKG
ncbi:MAG: helix-turn-helix domain-containing protein [bacterium]